MPITYPLDFPTGPHVGAVRFTPKNTVSINKSPFTGQEQVQKFSGQWWEVEVALTPMKRENAEIFIAFFLSLQGRYGTFLMGDPTGGIPRGVATLTGSLYVPVSSMSGGEITVAGFATNTSSMLRMGDWIQVGSGLTSRIHRVLQDVASNSAGWVTAPVWPDLRYSPSSGEMCAVNSTVGLFRLAANEMPWTVAEAQIYGLTFAATEVV